MALPTMTTNVANHAAVVEDYPQDNGANPITPTGLRELLDKGAVDIKSFLNDILIPALIAEYIPFTATAGISSTNIQDAIEETYAAIAEAVSGEIVDGSITFAKLASEAIASQATAEAGTSDTTLSTPHRVAQYVAYILSTLAEAQAGTSETKLVTPKRVADYVTYIKATQAEAEAGVNTTHWTTPQRVSQAITALGPHVMVGSYTGTGTTGSSNPNSIVFSFAPKIGFVVRRSARYFDYAFYVHSLTTSYTEYGYSPVAGTSSNKYMAKKSADGLTVYWYYNDTDAGAQLNTTGETYDYMFIG